MFNWPRRQFISPTLARTSPTSASATLWLGRLCCMSAVLPTNKFPTRKLNQPPFRLCGPLKGQLSCRFRQRDDLDVDAEIGELCDKALGDDLG